MYNILAKILKLLNPFLIIWNAIQDNTNSDSSIFIAVVINEMHVQEENYIQERERRNYLLLEMGTSITLLKIVPSF